MSQLRQAAKRTRRVALFVQGLVVVWVVLSIVAGIIIAASSDQTCSVDGSCSLSHPYVGAGFSVMAGVLFLGAFALLAASYIHMRALAVLQAPVARLADGGEGLSRGETLLRSLYQQGLTPNEVSERLDDAYESGHLARQDYEAVRAFNDEPDDAALQ